MTGNLLTSANVGAAVWNALATASNLPDTMGEKLNLASAGGVDYGALADAVWEAAIEDGVTAAQMLRVLLSSVAGDCVVTDIGGGSFTIEFKSIDGAVTRISGTASSAGDRSGTSINGA